MKVAVYRPREAKGLGAPVAFLGEEHPVQGDWVESAKAEFKKDDYRPLLTLGRAFLIYSMYHVREPLFLGYAVENFGAAVQMLGYKLPLTADDATWRPYNHEGLDPGQPEDYQLLFRQIAAVFGSDAANSQAAELGIRWECDRVHQPAS